MFTDLFTYLFKSPENSAVRGRLLFSIAILYRGVRWLIVVDVVVVTSIGRHPVTFLPFISTVSDSIVRRYCSCRLTESKVHVHRDGLKWIPIGWVVQCLMQVYRFWCLPSDDLETYNDLGSSYSNYRTVCYSYMVQFIRAASVWNFATLSAKNVRFWGNFAEDYMHSAEYGINSSAELPSISAISFLSKISRIWQICPCSALGV